MKQHYIFVYNIGQGLCTMLRTLLDGVNYYLGIFDCGTLRERNKEEVINNIVLQAQQHGRINSIVISHQDLDHRSLLLDIIWKFYGITSDEIIYHNDFYFKKTRDTTTIYEEMGDSVIEYLNLSEGYGYNSDFSGAVDEHENIQWFQLSRRVDKSEGIGECNFKLFWNNACKIMVLHVFIGDVLVGKEMDSGRSIAIPYEKIFLISWNEPFCSSKWHSLKDVIGGQYKEIEATIQDNRRVRFRWNRFLDYIDEFTNKFTYNSMKRKLSQPTNFNSQGCFIGKIWLGGGYWEIGYRRLYYILTKLVKVGLVYNVNGFTKDSTISYGADMRFCGLMRVNEETICLDEVKTQVFDIKDNLVDCVTYKTGITPAIAHNATSLIVEFNISTKETRRRIIFPGDATVHVFGQLAAELDGPDELNGFSSTFFMAPHHGSLRTNYCGGEQQPFHMLLNKLTANKEKKLNTCVISALGEVFRHPDKRFVDDMREYVEPAYPSSSTHHICYFEGRERRVDNESKAIYCTEMMPNIGMMWDSDFSPVAAVGRAEQRKIFPGRNVFI